MSTSSGFFPTLFVISVNWVEINKYTVKRGMAVLHYKRENASPTFDSWFYKTKWLILEGKKQGIVCKHEWKLKNTHSRDLFDS
jgi:hypothetical protein